MTKKVAKTAARKSLGQLRHFSEAVKRQTVKDIEQGKCTVLEASRELSVSLTSVYNWVYKFSGYLQKSRKLVMEDDSEMYKTKVLEAKLRAAEAALGRKQMEVEILNKVIELAGAELNMDLKKSFSIPVLNGTAAIKG
jgi:transposase-like protein